MNKSLFSLVLMLSASVSFAQATADSAYQKVAISTVDTSSSKATTTNRVVLSVDSDQKLVELDDRTRAVDDILATPVL